MGIRRTYFKKVVRWKKRSKKRSSTPSISKLMKECDRRFSLTVRHSGASSDGFNVCFTCGKSFPVKKLHNGHYLSRYYKAARWHRDNCRPQCFMCNVWKKGDTVAFRRNLISQIGEARVLDVEKLRDAPIKLTREYLESLLQSLL